MSAHLKLLKPFALGLALAFIPLSAQGEPPVDEKLFTVTDEDTIGDDELLSVLGALMIMDEDALKAWDPTDPDDPISIFMSSTSSKDDRPEANLRETAPEGSQLYRYFKGEAAEPLPKLTPLQVGAPQDQKPILDLSRPPEDTSNSSSTIFDKLSGIAEEEEEEEVQARPPALLIEKPVSGENTSIDLSEKPVAPEAPALSVKASTLPSNIGVKPVETQPRVTAADIMKATGKDKIYGPAPCVWTSVGKRNLLGKSEVKFTNNCGRDAEVGARFCEPGKADRQDVISIPANGHASRNLAHRKDESPKYGFSFCTEKGCAPKLPASCEN